MDNKNNSEHLLQEFTELGEKAGKASRRLAGPASGLLKMQYMKHLRMLNATQQTLQFRVRFLSETTIGTMWLPENGQFTDWYAIGPERSYIPRLDQEHIMGMQAEIQIHPNSVPITGYERRTIWLCRRPYTSPMIADFVVFLLAKGQKEPNTLKTMWIITMNGQTA